MTDNLGSFDSSTPGVAAVTASASGGGNNGVHGMTSSNDGSALYGEHLGNGIGVFGRGGQTAGGWGVFGQTNSSASGVYGKNTSNGAGVVVRALAALVCSVSVSLRAASRATSR